MPQRQINDVDVVAHAGSIRGWIAVAKHRQLCQPADSHLTHIRKQIIGNAAGIFPNLAAGMSAHRVEVAQQGDAPARVGNRQVAQHLLDNQLGTAVWVRGR